MDRVEEVVLVDERGRETGTAEKHQAHLDGRLHRAFSVFLVDDQGQLLLQRRSHIKYHSPGLWANSCCGHPRPGEVIAVAARRRVSEELGVDVGLVYGFQARYEASVGNGMVENELVDIFFGKYPGEVHPDPDEVAEVALFSLGRLSELARTLPHAYTVWLQLYLAEHYSGIEAGIRALTE